MADTLKSKPILDKYWKYFDFVYDYRAAFTGTGRRF